MTPPAPDDPLDSMHLFGAPDPEDTFTVALGRRLRHLRGIAGLSLAAAAAKSEGRFKTAALGSYERGERAIPVRGLFLLADLYGISVADLVCGLENAAYDHAA